MLKSNMCSQNGAEVVFFDLETTVPRTAGARIWVLDFGAIVVCPQKLEELESQCTLIRPTDLSVVNLKSGRVDGITRETVRTAPKFEDGADSIFGLLKGKVCARYNIQRFDCPRIREAFVATGRATPVPVGTIDSLGILTQKFGRRARNMKMATLAAYFGLGEQKHRSLDDVRMNLEVISTGSPAVATRSRINGRLRSYGGEKSRKSPPISSLGCHKVLPYARNTTDMFDSSTTCGIKHVCTVTNSRTRHYSLLLSWLT
ncbi:hypothetical protein MKW92_024371 [Papaver armeniacum]|nr:hypothetical protein MKW92_024371 [Papaver armeniacum]